jgi:coenzyme F420 hydrogenase subunit beta
MSAQKQGFEETLKEKVVTEELCAGCAACVLVCPFGCLEYFEEKPSLVKKCEICGICPRVCPRFEFSQSALERLVFQRERNRDEEFGVYQRLVIAKATDQNILSTCQDGGVVTALLTYALNNGIIDSAILACTDPEKPFFPLPKLVSNANEVLECAGTKYTYSPNLLVLQEAVKEKKKSVAFVSTPCQIQAIRKIEAFPLKKYSGIIKFTVGLMCTESFTYAGLMQRHIQQALGVNLHDVKKINIKGKVLVTTNAGETKAIPLQDAKQYTRKGCLPCTDFSAELADISTGGLGLNGWTFTVVRTEKGDEIFQGAERTGAVLTRPVEEEKNALDLLVKLSKKKRKTG